MSDIDTEALEQVIKTYYNVCAFYPKEVEIVKKATAELVKLINNYEMFRDAHAFDEDRIQHLEGEIAQLHAELEEKNLH